MKTIKIKETTHMILIILKLQNNFKTIDEVIDKLIDESIELNQQHKMTIAEYREAYKDGKIK